VSRGLDKPGRFPLSRVLCINLSMTLVPGGKMTDNTSSRRIDHKTLIDNEPLFLNLKQAGVTVYKKLSSSSLSSSEQGMSIDLRGVTTRRVRRGRTDVRDRPDLRRSTAR
jgi:hypothetical protein